jgi:ABC-type uncharacterized transport system permease subunit
MYELVTSGQLWLAILGSSLIATVFNKLFDYFTGRRKTDQILLLEAIERQTDKIVAQGYRTHIQTQRIQEAYQQYKKLGGDGYADSLLADAMRMPLKG